MSGESVRSGKLLLALDLGNTSLNCGVFDGADLLVRQCIPVVELIESPEVWDGRLPEGTLDRVGVSVFSSVNPRRALLVRASLGRRLSKAPLMLGTDVPIPVQMRVDRPEEVGSDRLLNVLAAYDRTHAACLIVDLGTTVTVDVCADDGAYLGGVIAPGLKMSASALHDHTALLPRVRIERPKAIVGRNTVECIRSGLFWGTVAMIEGLIERLRREQPETGCVLATGGDAPAIASVCSVIDEVVPNLALDGLRLTASSAGLVP